MKPKQEETTAWIPKSQTKWILGLLGGVSVVGCRQGASDPLQSIPPTAAFQCWEKRSARKYHRLDQGDQNGIISFVPKATCFWLGLRMCPAEPVGKPHEGAATAPVNVSLNSGPEPAVNPIILSTSGPNCSLPGDLQMEFVTWRSQEQERGLCRAFVGGILEKLGKEII